MHDTPRSVRSPLPVDTRAPAMARALVARVASPQGRTRDLDLARLLASELVTNAVRHGAAPITIEVACEPGSALDVRVSDEGPARPLLRWSAQAAGEPRRAGWGLVFVDLMSDAWGVDEAEFGKTVWFRMRPPA